ncbi:DeoR/GlpR family DNA-binding transcription regulator [Aureimonas ureilytica]|uniref:DeoR/GlpR family DNA-binding transcription regulator n=1 Tax=Aureimonas ureilytica TaxID=401562 RepID=UPI0003779BD3|nr:DeoR/GlpR family DNA-binding transcription regulator [Aureimonas ureilytica]
MGKGDRRREEIANFVIAQGQVRIDDLIERFGVSRMTVHRHIDQLAAQGVLRKLHGAVSAQPSGIYESLFRYRTTLATPQKQALARAALDLIEPGQVVMLDDSSTAAALAPLLPERAPLTVVTNGLPVATALKEADGVDLICLGGQYHRTYDAFIGLVCESAIARLRADVLVCSASAVSGTSAFIQDGQMVRAKQAMMAASARRLLLLDDTKFGRTALHLFADLSAFDTVLASASLDAETVRRLDEAGIALRLVETEIR